MAAAQSDVLHHHLQVRKNKLLTAIIMFQMMGNTMAPSRILSDVSGNRCSMVVAIELVVLYLLFWIFDCRQDRKVLLLNSSSCWTSKPQVWLLHFCCHLVYRLIDILAIIVSFWKPPSCFFNKKMNAISLCELQVALYTVYSHSYSKCSKYEILKQLVKFFKYFRNYIGHKKQSFELQQCTQ